MEINTNSIQQLLFYKGKDRSIYQKKLERWFDHIREEKPLVNLSSYSGLEYKSFKNISVSLFPKADIFKTLRAWQLVLKGILVLLSTLQSQPSSLVFNRSFDRAWHTLYPRSFTAFIDKGVKIPCSRAPSLLCPAVPVLEAQQITRGFLLHLSSCTDESPGLSAASRD